jgi:hypothetical protein
VQSREAADIRLRDRIERKPEVEMERLKVPALSRVRRRENKASDNLESSDTLDIAARLDQPPRETTRARRLQKPLAHPHEAVLRQVPNTLVHGCILPCLGCDRRQREQPHLTRDRESASRGPPTSAQQARATMSTGVTVAAQECPENCVGMDSRTETHVDDNLKQVG